MIPQPLKWVGAIIALIIVVAVVGPMTFEAISEMVTFSDGGGLFTAESDDPLDEDALEEDAPEPDEDGAEASTDETEGQEDHDEDAADEDSGEPVDDDNDETPDSYTVQGGDTLFSISQEFYGDGGRWREIADANDISDSTGITVGQELVIP